MPAVRIAMKEMKLEMIAPMPEMIAMMIAMTKISAESFHKY